MTNYNEDAAYEAGRKFVDVLARIVLLPFIVIFACLWVFFIALWVCVSFLFWLFGREVEFKRKGRVVASLKWFKLNKY